MVQTSMIYGIYRYIKVLSTTYLQPTAEHYTGYIYGRLGNPTRKTLERTLASLENAKYAHCFSSGMGVVSSLSFLLQTGDHVIVGVG
jgi:cystathionine beta-lyase/cystathionine gamma-synthase